MLGWLEKAKGSLSRQTMPGPEPFSVGCDCGKVVQGERQSEAQQVRCPGCGDPVFVLPRNVYPVPKAKPGKKKKAKQRQEKVVSVPWHVVLKHQRTRVQTWSQLRCRMIFQKVIRLFTPLRLITIAIIVLITATSYWSLRNRAIDQAGLTYLQSAREGLASIEEQELILAEQHLQAAVAALDLLKYDDQEGQTLRQRFREVQAINNMLGDSLADVIEDAKKTMRSGENWQEKFQSRYRGKWLVLETALNSTATPGEYRLNCPLLLNREQLNIVGQLATLDQFPRAAGGSLVQHMVIVAVQLKACERNPDNSANWIVEIEPETAFLWSGLKTYTALGFDLEPDNPFAKPTRTLLEQQSRQMGVSP